MGQIFKLFACCIPVKGPKRSIICDLQRMNYEFIPNGLYDILINNADATLDEIKTEFNNQYDHTIDGYFDFLLKNEFGWFIDKEDAEKFPKLSMQWHEPSTISNAIIDVGSIDHNFGNIIPQLEHLGCQHIQVRFFVHKNMSMYDELMAAIKNSIIKSTELFLKYDEDLDYSYLSQIANDVARIKKIIVHSTPQNFNFSINASYSKSKIYYVTQIIEDESHCGYITPEDFVINIKSFTEAISFNSCLNKKVGIDRHGNIKNCPTMLNSFGNINNINLVEAIQASGFTKLWGMTKDDIEICCDCEFRYICTDCRAHVTEKINKKPAKCKYDPYTAQWG